MNRKLRSWEKWNLDAKKEKERILRRRCTNCKETFEKNGLSAYEGLCKKCVEGN